MSTQPIPEVWRKAVCADLHAAGKRIEYTDDFYDRWQQDFPGETALGLLDDFETMLSQSLQGCPVTMDPPAKAGVTWEFWFIHGGERAYGKILLRKDGRGIVLYSAHLPKRKHLRCE